MLMQSKIYVTHRFFWSCLALHKIAAAGAVVLGSSTSGERNMMTKVTKRYYLSVLYTFAI